MTGEKNESKVVLISNLVKTFPIGGGEFTALSGINLSFEKGEFAGLVGPSGSGKTTLLNIIGSLDAPTEGSALVLSNSISELSHAQAAQLRSEKLGFIFQTYNLLPVYTVYENVEFPLLLLGIGAEKRKEAVMKALAAVGLCEKANSKPAQLSGGESQRVAIARALVGNPALVLADEPTGNLDQDTGKTILTMISDLVRTQNKTLIMVTHSPDAADWADQMYAVADGALAAMETDPRE